jgi:hypothetical protein
METFLNWLDIQNEQQAIPPAVAKIPAQPMKPMGSPTVANNPANPQTPGTAQGKPLVSDGGTVTANIQGKNVKLPADPTQRAKMLQAMLQRPGQQVQGNQVQQGKQVQQVQQVQGKQVQQGQVKR